MTTDEIFQILKADTTNIFGGLAIYNQLFESQKTVDILNAFGAMVFVTYQNNFLDSCILFISRMTDPSTTGRNDNVSLKSLISKLPQDSASLAENMRAEMSSINKGITKIRSKRIAHCDFEVRSGNLKLDSVEFKHIEDGLNSIAKTLNMYELHSTNSSTLYSETILPLASDGRYLLNRLKKSEAYIAIEISGGCEVNMWRDAF